MNARGNGIAISKMAPQILKKSTRSTSSPAPGIPQKFSGPIVDFTNLSTIPDSSGVYLFYGSQEELLYVGKSKTLRARVRSHFGDRKERRMMRGVRKIEIRETAGELGALLLESQLIKELRPLFNIMARRRRKLVVARRTENESGHIVVSLQAIDYLHVDTSSSILGLFKHTTQAKEFLAKVARDFRLCHKLLKLEQTRGYCFAYHLGKCDGACAGDEAAESYNARVEQAFAERRIQAWPFDGPIVVEEGVGTDVREWFLIDNWCMLGGLTSIGCNQETQRRFDYDSYKILYAYLSDERNRVNVRSGTSVEWKQLQERVAAEMSQKSVTIVPR